MPDLPNAAAVPKRPQILCVMRMPPNVNGHGGSQRAWYLLHALLALGDVHFVLVFREIDRDCMETPLDHLQPLVASVTRINIEEWQPRMTKKFGVVPGGVWDLFTKRSQEAPELSAAQLEKVAAQLTVRQPDLIFAGRLCTAVILQSLLDRKLLSSRERVVDFDDIMSKFAARQVRTAGAALKWRKRMRLRIDSFIVARAENRIAAQWHGISVCTDEDVADLVKAHPGRSVLKVPNVVARHRLPPRAEDGRFRLLFAGNLGFAPNVEGLRVFVENAWPALRAQVPHAELTVVGMNPTGTVVELTRQHGIPLHANVPSLEPYYAECDAVIAPILFGSGTRIKILEAMAYGRTVVSTTVGAEGMGLVSGEHLLIADAMADFAQALVRLARDRPLNLAFAERAHAFQQAHYTPQALSAAVATLVERGRSQVPDVPGSSRTDADKVRA